MPAFPTLVYRAPGSSQHSSGGRYRYRGAANQVEYDALLAEGWHSTILAAVVAAGDRAFAHNRKPAGLLAKARAKLAEQAPVAVVEAEDDAPATRVEMEAKATELGVKFDGRTTDARLLAKIAEALRAASDPI
jgi:hypothetical protein